MINTNTQRGLTCTDTVHEKLMSDLMESVEKRREYVATLPPRARELLRKGKGEEALEMVLTELSSTQTRNRALHRRLDRLDGNQ